MPITITGKHLEVGDSLRDFIGQELRKVVSHYMGGDILEAQVTISKSHISKEKSAFKIDISVHISRNFVAHCHGQDEDAYRSATVAVEKLEARIKKYKNRLQDKKRHRDGEHEPMFAQQYILNAEEDSGEDTPLIIAEMPSEISRLSVGEAVMRMDLADVPLMMFRNASNGELNVVYKRHDGHVGWIDPSRKMA